MIMESIGNHKNNFLTLSILRNIIFPVIPIVPTKNATMLNIPNSNAVYRHCGEGVKVPIYLPNHRSKCNDTQIVYEP